MLLRRILINLMLFSRMISTEIQINLHRTHWLNNDDNIQHNCLYISVPFTNEYDERHILAFCMTESPVSKFHLKPNYNDPIFTFDQLAEKNVTTEELYLWSAPIDLIEQYQIYLNNPESLYGNETFYNCTLPYFGPQCQYIFKDLNYSQPSLDKMIDEYYALNMYEPMLLTCYQHLKCNRGPSPACLDWTEICDGKIDCLDGSGLDEEHCWQLEDVDRCDKNQFQCSNGQCIPAKSANENKYSFDCIDQSDEPIENHGPIYSSPFFKGPIFAFDDVSCIHLNSVGQFNFYPWLSSCVNNRLHILLYTMISMKPTSISDECWAAFKCIIHIPMADSYICRLICHDGFCDRILQIKCSDFIYLSAIPILYGHVNLLFNKNTFDGLKYVCFDRKRFHIYNLDPNVLLLFNNDACLPVQGSICYGFERGYHWLTEYVSCVRMWFQENSDSLDNNLTKYLNSSLYKCANSPRYVANYRVHDGISDCFYDDDENGNIKIDSTCPTNRNDMYFHCSNESCISKQYVNDGSCNCVNSELFCSDEDKLTSDLQFSSLFPVICNGHTDVGDLQFELLLDNDETDCDFWPPIHIYNRCDGRWDVADGSDELNCEPSSIKCAEDHLSCVSQETNQIICLPNNKTNDGVIDCIGSIDESQYCYERSQRYRFHCPNNFMRKCIQIDIFCGRRSFCIQSDYEEVCRIGDWQTKRLVKTFHSFEQIDCLDTAKLICKQYMYSTGKKQRYFTLDQQTNEDISVTPQKPIYLDLEPKSYQQRCHRGLDLQVYLDKSKNLTTSVCLCPPSYYGDTCQYQNQRISLTLQFRVSSDSIQIPFIIIISLIDNSQQRTIHSTEQFTYLSRKYCQKKFHIYLLYSTRPKDQSREYFIHIDIYEKITLRYRTSFIKNIKYSFLPVHRLVYQLDIPPKVDDSIESCSDRQCQYGKCISYTNDLTLKNQSFCQCERSWSGQSCSIKYDCQCSIDALCLGQLANNRSLCVCPLNRKGPNCFIKDTICSNQTCSNRGQCITLDEHDLSTNKSTCVCDKVSDDEFCRFNRTQLTLSFNEHLFVPSTISIHFIEVRTNDHPNRATISKHIYFGQYSTVIYWPLPFHLVFVQFDNQTYYLAHIQKIYKQSSVIKSFVQSYNQCLPITDLFNETITNSHLLTRIKYYHQPCQRSDLDLQCFYDNAQLCLCQQVDQYRVANCFGFDHKKKSLCSAINGCKNGGTCFQEDNNDCSRISFCLCPTCFYGSQCEINTNVYYLSLDTILGFRITPNIQLTKQSSAILISLYVTIVVVLFGLLNASFVLITFKNANTRKSGCGVYLLCSSILTYFTMFFFLFKFLIVLLSQIGTITDYLFLKIQCYAIDFLLRCSLTIGQWLTAFVAIERVVITLKGIHFQQKNAKYYSKWVIVCSILFVLLTNIHDSFHRTLFTENENEQQRYWCIVEYSSKYIEIYNTVITTFHFISPFIINFTSAIIIIVVKTRQQVIFHEKNKNQTVYRRKILIKQIRQHQNILIAPCVLTILDIPRLIISFTSSCIKSPNDFWFYLIGNYSSLIPSLLTFTIYVLPSSAYKQAFRKVISRYRRILFNTL